ncbi:MAG: hypothetical protein IPL61_27690 [Myxococcales bacterium]|nr:hypothetical protein [Myxococcales bacterium]
MEARGDGDADLRAPGDGPLGAGLEVLRRGDPLRGPLEHLAEGPLRGGGDEPVLVDQRPEVRRGAREQVGQAVEVVAAEHVVDPLEHLEAQRAVGVAPGQARWQREVLAGQMLPQRRTDVRQQVGAHVLTGGDVGALAGRLLEEPGGADVGEVVLRRGGLPLDGAVA